MTATEPCERAARCRNFRLEPAPRCNRCDARLVSAHYQSRPGRYRLCARCFEAHLDEIVAGTYRPPTWVHSEPRRCALTEICFAETPFDLYRPRLCSACGRANPAEHFHDPELELRFCLDCYLERRERHGLATSRSALDQTAPR